jgi:ABC-type multidrug transport system fused ATPase/permease subunit
MHERVEDIIQNMPSVYAANTKDQELEHLRVDSHTYSNMYANTVNCTSKFKAVMIPATAMLIAGFVLRSKFMIDSGVINKSAFVPMFTIMTSMLGSIFWLVDITRYAVFDLGSVSNVDATLAALPATPRYILDPTLAPPLAVKSVIGIQNVTFTYKNKRILNDITLNFVTGKCTALVGAIGCGKSTIMKLLLGFHIPERGDAYLNGSWYRDLSIHDVRQQVGYVPQNPVLFNDTVMYNIKYGNSDITDEEVMDIVGNLGLSSDFLERDVGKGGMHLSGGQRQLVWCLRVFLKNPDVLLLDEPTASMDRESKDILLVLLSTLMKDRTVIIVTHDSYLLEHVDEKVTVG